MGLQFSNRDQDTLGIQIAQSRSDLYTLRPKLSIIYVLGAMGIEIETDIVIDNVVRDKRDL